MYEIKVLDSKEFDELKHTDPRYSYVDETNLGFADREKGTAYVRQTHVHELNKYLISHELEELEQDESTHEDPNGIRHKKGPKIFKDLIAPLFGIPSEAPQREAAQTTNVPGMGNVLNSELAGMGMGGQSGSYSPMGSFGQSFGFGSPLNLFSGSSPSSGRVPDVASGSYSPSGNLGGGLDSLPPEILNLLKQRQSGSEGGGIRF